MRVRRMAIGLILVLTCVGGAVLLLQPREPRNGGRSLRHWVALGNAEPSRESPENNGVQNAIRQMGTNAVPFLVRWIKREPSKFKKIISSAARRWPLQREIHWRSEDESVLDANRAMA